MDSANHAIEAAARDYIEGWFTADAMRMGRALHPELVKRSVGEGTLSTLTRDQMLAATEAGVAHAAEQVFVIDDIRVEGDIASARVQSTAFIDFVHLTREGGTWRIVNAVWRAR